MNRLALSTRTSNPFVRNIHIVGGRRVIPRIGQQPTTSFDGRSSRPQNCCSYRLAAATPFSTTATATTTSTTINETSSLSTIRTRILQSALEEVHQHGWTDEALSAATASVIAPQKQQISMSVVGMITVDELIGYCMDHWNEQLRLDLVKHKSLHNNASGDEDPLQHGIKLRLQYLIPYLQSSRWHEGMALGIRGPSNAIQTQKQLQQMIDIIVTEASTTPSTTSSLGTPERMALGAVYVATELHLLTDQSPQYEETWKFLHHRMQDWYQICSLLKSTGGTSFSPSPPLGGVGGNAGDALFVVSSVASSLMGGLVSLVMPPSSNKSIIGSVVGGGLFGLPEAVWTSLFASQNNSNPSSTTSQWNPKKKQQQQSGGEGGAPGTHPDDYSVPQKQA